MDNVRPKSKKTIKIIIEIKKTEMEYKKKIHIEKLKCLVDNCNKKFIVVNYNYAECHKHLQTKHPNVSDAMCHFILQVDKVDGRHEEEK